jgi:hypothetical protein
LRVKSLDPLFARSQSNSSTGPAGIWIGMGPLKVHRNGHARLQAAGMPLEWAGARAGMLALRHPAPLNDNWSLLDRLRMDSSPDVPPRFTGISLGY